MDLDKTVALLRHAALFFRRGESAHAVIPFVQLDAPEDLAAAIARGDDLECAEIVDRMIKELTNGTETRPTEPLRT